MEISPRRSRAGPHGKSRFNPGDVEKHAAMGAAAALFDFADDASGHAVVREQFRRGRFKLRQLGMVGNCFSTRTRVAREARGVMVQLIDSRASPS